MDAGYEVRRSQRARTLRVTVQPDGLVVVTLPPRGTHRAAAEAVRRLQPWIAARRSEMAATAAELAWEPGTVPFLGRPLTLVAEPGRVRVGRRGDRLLVPADQAGPALERWYRRRAHAEIAARLDAACARAGTAYDGLTIRDPRTRWASCSPSGRMSFSYRLLLVPEAVLDYVVEHEVCHLERPGHDAAFWELLASRVPGWRDHARWLRRYGAAVAVAAPFR